MATDPGKRAGRGAAAEPRDSHRRRTRQFWIGLARAFGGAIFFALPLLMTMEMWWLGFYMDRLRLALLIAAMIPLLIALDHFAGFKETTTWSEDVADGMIAYGVGVVAAIVVLSLFGVLNLQTPLREWIGTVALEAVPASLGAVLASSQLGGAPDEVTEGEEEEEKEERMQEAGYAGELLFMVAGALFVGFSVAPTEEMMLIAFKMTPWNALALALVTLVLMHAFVYAVEFHGTPAADDAPGWSLFLRFTMTGYAIALLVSGYVLWTFGRFDTAAVGEQILQTLVLGFPAALGASAARLII